MSWYFMGLQKYAIFNGRASVREYWMFFLFKYIFLFSLIFLEYIISSIFVNQDWPFGILSLLYLIVLYIPSLAVLVRRLHDTNKSGWWYFISSIPLVGTLWLLTLLVDKGQQGNNEYGPNPFVTIPSDGQERNEIIVKEKSSNNNWGIASEVMKQEPEESKYKITENISSNRNEFKILKYSFFISIVFVAIFIASSIYYYQSNKKTYQDYNRVLTLYSMQNSNVLSLVQTNNDLKNNISTLESSITAQNQNQGSQLITAKKNENTERSDINHIDGITYLDSGSGLFTAEWGLKYFKLKTYSRSEKYSLSSINNYSLDNLIIYYKSQLEMNDYKIEEIQMDLPYFANDEKLSTMTSWKGEDKICIAISPMGGGSYNLFFIWGN